MNILAIEIFSYPEMSFQNSEGAWGSTEKGERQAEQFSDNTEVVPFSMSDFEESYEQERETKTQPSSDRVANQRNQVSEEFEDIFSSEDEECEGLDQRLSLERALNVAHLDRIYKHDEGALK